MLENHHLQHQGLIVEDHQAVGLVGFFTNPSNSNSLAFLHHPHHDDDDDHLASSHGHAHHPSLKPFASMMQPPRDVDVEDDDHDTPHSHGHHGATTDLCQALLISCSNPNPKGILHHHHHQYHHQDPSSLMGALPHHIPWEWRSDGGECLGSKRPSFSGENEQSVDIEDDHHHHENNNNVHIGLGNEEMMEKKSLLGVSALQMKKMKGRRKVREPKFSFKTLSVDVDVLDDGYKWRKYGQKVVKNTQHPRSYYRCTQDKCRVKKRVERLAEDPRMVITSYEGRHIHSPSHDNPDEEYSNKALPILNNFFW